MLYFFQTWLEKLKFPAIGTYISTKKRQPNLERTFYANKLIIKKIQRLMKDGISQKTDCT